MLKQFKKIFREIRESYDDKIQKWKIGNPFALFEK